MYAVVDVDGQVGVLVDVTLVVYEISLLVQMAGCLGSQFYRRGLGLRDAKAKIGAHTVAITISIFLSCSGDCETTVESSAHGKPNTVCGARDWISYRRYHSPTSPLGYMFAHQSVHDMPRSTSRPLVV